MLRRKSKADKPAKAPKDKKAKAKAPKAAKAAKAKKVKAPVDGIALPKPATNVYTVMLGLAFIALLVGVLFLLAHINTYGDFPQWKTPNV